MNRNNEAEIKQWEDVLIASGLIELAELDNDWPFVGWLGAQELDLLAGAISTLRHEIKGWNGLHGISGGFCRLVILEVFDSGIILGAHFGVSNDGQRSVTWSRIKVPRSYFDDREITHDDLANKIHWETEWEHAGSINVERSESDYENYDDAEIDDNYRRTEVTSCVN